MRCASSWLVPFVVVPLIASPAIAQTAQTSAHVRVHADVAELVAEAASRSPTIHLLIDRLEALDVTVYVRRQRFPQSELEGRTGLLSRVGDHRYLVIELASGRSRMSEMATFGHELFHAVEIASDASIVDVSALTALYRRIGFRIDNTPGRQTFETNGAAEAGRQATRELFSPPRTTTALR